MADKLETLERLNLLFDEGRITSEEFKQLKDELFGNKQEQSVPTSTRSAGIALENEPPPPLKEDDGTPLLGEPRSPIVRALAGTKQAGRSDTNQPTPTIYKVALGAGIVSVFLGGTFGLLAWATAVVGGAALISEKSLRRRWMAWIGLSLGVLFSLVNAHVNGHFDSLLGDGVTEWSSSDVSAVVGYCEEKEAHTNCGSLAEALRASGCTASEAFGYVDDEAFALTHSVPVGAGPLTRARYTPHGILGTDSYCGVQAMFRDS